MRRCAVTTPTGSLWCRLAVIASTPAADVAAAVTRAIRRGGSVEVDAAGPEALQHALAGLVSARGELAPEGREIAVAPSFAGADEDVLRLRVLPATLSPGQLHERLRAQLEDLMGGESSYLDVLADRLTAAVLTGTAA